MFRRLNQDDRSHLAGVSRLKSYAKGERIFGEGDPSDFFSVVVSGRVKIVKMTPAGKDVILEIFGTGDPFGAVAAYEGRPFPASAIALEDTVCLLTPRQAFFSLLEQHPSLVRGLLLGLTQRLVELTNRLTEMTRRPRRSAVRAAVSQARRQHRASRPGGHHDSDGVVAAGARRPDRHDDRNLHPHHEPLGQGRHRANREGRLRARRQDRARGAGSDLIARYDRRHSLPAPG